MKIKFNQIKMKVYLSFHKNIKQHSWHIEREKVLKMVLSVHKVEWVRICTIFQKFKI